ncbi:hypothetical protein EYZ11_008596 [Aspergillus tanneri]|uniref:Zn(2)-C6 fungal-type domain-containing protein n=1 Tax=Aspergillus tanneri TaxID=1220188 RepID=A0A4S3JFJ1_9EURO|nr:hypothetical protein EYZ11_008596 [Aspergillus tanneri]
MTESAVSILPGTGVADKSTKEALLTTECLTCRVRKVKCDEGKLR